MFKSIISGATTKLGGGGFSRSYSNGAVGPAQASFRTPREGAENSGIIELGENGQNTWNAPYFHIFV